MYSNNLLPANEESRAQEFAKNRHQQTRGHDTDLRLKHIDEELSYWKQRVLSAPVENKNQIADRLIKLRAEQTTIFLNALFTDPNDQEHDKAKKLIVRYYRDCARLLKAINCGPTE